MKRFTEYVEKRELEEGILPKTKDFLRAIPLTAALLGTNYMAGDPIRNTVHSIIGNQEFSKSDILASFKVIPKELIRSSQFDVNKWDKDYEKLQSPGEADYGFAIHKDLLDKPAIVHVIKHNAITKNADRHIRVGFARPDTLEVFMSDLFFKELPSNGNIGKLTRSGLNTLSHELRHLAQAEPPSDRSSSLTDPNEKYMNNPVEMGVRLAALKNLLSPRMFERVGELINLPNKRLAISVLPNDEKQMLDFVLNPKKWSKAMYNQGISQGLKIDEDDCFKLAVAFANKLGEMNSDISSLLQHYRLLTPAKKSVYFQELLDSFDQVVSNQVNKRKYV